MPEHFPFWLDDERRKVHCLEESVGPESRAMRVWGELRLQLVNVPQRGVELLTRRLIEDEPARYCYEVVLGLRKRGTVRLVEVKPSVVRESGDEDAFEVNARFIMPGKPVLEEIPYARPARPRRDSFEDIPDAGPNCPQGLKDTINLWRAAEKRYRAAEKSWAQYTEV